MPTFDAVTPVASEAAPSFEEKKEEAVDPAEKKRLARALWSFNRHIYIYYIQYSIDVYVYIIHNISKIYDMTYLQHRYTIYPFYIYTGSAHSFCLRSGKL